MLDDNQIHDLVSPNMSSATVERILQALKGLRYGAVELLIHDGRVVQIERKEKVRLEISSDKRSGR